MSSEQREELWSYKHLSDFNEGDILILKNYRTQTTNKGDTLLFAEYEKHESGEVYSSGTLSLPTRFLQKCTEHSPCLIVYLGMCKSASGRNYYNLKFLNAKENLS